MKKRLNRINEFIASLHDAGLSDNQASFLFATGGKEEAKGKNIRCHNTKCEINVKCPGRKSNTEDPNVDCTNIDCSFNGGCDINPKQCRMNMGSCKVNSHPDCRKS